MGKNTAMQELIKLIIKKYEIKKEIVSIIKLIFAGFIALWIAFNKENILNILKIYAGFLWVFIFPGYFALLLWKESLSFLERGIISVPLSAAMFGLLSYALGIIGVHVKYHGILLPLIFIIVSISIIIKKESSLQKEKQ